MKISTLRLCLIFLAISLQFSSYAQQPKESEIIGTYFLSFDDMDLTPEKKEMIKVMMSSFVITLKENGNLAVAVMEKKETGTYTLKGTELTMTIQGDDQKAILIDGQISMKTADIDLVFKKGVAPIIEEVEVENETSLISNNDGINGTYFLSVDDMKLSDQEKTMIAPMAKDMKIELRKDNQLSLSMMGQKETGTYEINDSMITMTLKGDAQVATISDGKITIDATAEGGPIMIFKKEEKSNGETEIIEEENTSVKANPKTSTSGLIGTYSISLDDMELSDEEKEMIAVMTKDMKLEVKPNGKYTLSMMSQSEEGNYTIKGNKILMTSKDGIQTGVMKDDKFFFDDRSSGGELLVFKKN